MIAPITDVAMNSDRLPRRMRQTLDGMLEGMSEKEIARLLAISHNTVHVYVKKVYRTYGVNSRSELLSLWIRGRSRPRHETTETLVTLKQRRSNAARVLQQLDQRIAAARTKLERLIEMRASLLE